MTEILTKWLILTFLSGGPRKTLLTLRVGSSLGHETETYRHGQRLEPPEVLRVSKSSMTSDSAWSP